MHFGKQIISFVSVVAGLLARGPQSNRRIEAILDEVKGNLQITNEGSGRCPNCGKIFVEVR